MKCLLDGEAYATTAGSRAGFVGASSAPRGAVVRASIWLLVAAAAALAASVAFRGDRYLAAVFPIIGLAMLQRLLLHRLARAHGAATNNSLPPKPLGGAA